ncbi:DUF998 domain-containing protein [Gordonia sp. i37]|uniref:DUF998 domain-containing protein n=1 Tax=Gordonia sp. i37 TaxID=1961707 RepID=UPI0009ABD978|nr:DUF998 domain-containing protein [Gordonia sp. i37]OPX15053.1 hypothetical protein B1964_11885 [Gordonia sp. i37]
MTLHHAVPAATPRAGFADLRPHVSAMLVAGAAAGPLFYLSALAQMATREGFDLRIHPISQLSTGQWGWVQMLTFVLAGLGLLCLAVGHRILVTTGIGRAALPLFIAVAGVGFIAAGIFPQDPSHGFPVGTPDGPAAETTWHALVHIVAAIVGFTAIALAAVIAFVRSIRERRSLSAVGNAVVALTLLLPVVPEVAGIQVAVTGLFAFGWCSATAIRLLRRGSSRSLA